MGWMLAWIHGFQPLIACDAFVGFGIAVGIAGGATVDPIKLAEAIEEIKNAASADPLSYFPPMIRAILLRNVSEENEAKGLPGST